MIVWKRPQTEMFLLELPNWNVRGLRYGWSLNVERWGLSVERWNVGRLAYGVWGLFSNA